MSAILSADDLNDFISPGVACIKPVETLPKQRPDQDDSSSNPYEVTTEDKVSSNLKEGAPAEISLTDCLACSGCVTSAEAVLVSLQSHQEVLNTLDAYESVGPEQVAYHGDIGERGKIFVASVSPQTRASVAALYGVSERHAGYIIEQLLAGPQGLKSGGQKGSGFTWIVDTNTLREACQAACVEEVLSTIPQPGVDGNAVNGDLYPRPKKPILASACPGWICYAEKTHPHILPHLSRLKSPQALAGTLLKSVLSRHLGVPADKIWHVAIMPCFDKKLEASREELTDTYWKSNEGEKRGVRDVDCVITARELVMLADTRGISLPNLPRTPVQRAPFPDPILDRFLFPRGRRRGSQRQAQIGGSSGGYAYHILKAQQARFPGSEIRTERGRNADVVEYALDQGDETIMRTARYYGFRNIQNLVRRLKPQKKSHMPGSKLSGVARRGEAANGANGASGGMTEYAYVEVMACPGGCTNGGGQIKASDVAEMIGLGELGKKTGPAEQKEWLARVDEAYYSADSSSEDESDAMDIDGIQDAEMDDVDVRNGHGEGYIKPVLLHWSSSTGIELDKLLFTTYRQVESDVGKDKGSSDMERVAGLASTLGGGW